MLTRVQGTIVGGLVLGSCLLAGCGQKGITDEMLASDTSVTSVPKTAQAAEAAAPAPMPRYASELPVIVPQKREPAAKVADFTWREKPRIEDVPDAPVSGSINGRPFLAKYASVTPDDEDDLPTTWLRFSSKPRGRWCSLALDDDSVSLEWHLPRGVGEWQRALSDERPKGSYAWFVLEQADGTPFTRDAPWACAVKITDVLGSTEQGGIESLKGKLAICFNDQEKSWIAGTFVADGCRQ